MDYDVGDDVPPNAASIPVRIETARKLLDNLPAYVVDVQHHAHLDHYPIFWDMIKDHYDYETNIHGARLYRLHKDRPSGVSAQ